jgi:hypothetical protein
MLMANENVRNLTAGQQNEFTMTILRNIPWDAITPSTLKKVGKNQKKLQADLRALLLEDVSTAEFSRVIRMRKGSTAKTLIAECKQLFPVHLKLNLDITSDRDTTEDYEICVRERVEADEELKNRSANDLKSEGIPGITLEERLQLELDYFKETGGHLDTQNITLCSGSRNALGGVPRVDWYNGRLCVLWCHPDTRNDDLRSRQVVS